MLRLEPGPGRIRTARRSEAWEGGGEYTTSSDINKDVPQLVGGGGARWAAEGWAT